MGNLAFGQSLDVWTIGTFVYVMLSNKRPFLDAQVKAGIWVSIFGSIIIILPPHVFGRLVFDSYRQF